MTTETRRYEKKRRAELEAETRRRITEKAVELHGTVGPARTSISAIAERAGVRRSTVYRHFPDEEALFAACSSHWAEANPLPDLARWTRIDDPDERLDAALDELYAFYGRTEQMMENLLRDEETVAVVKRLFSAYHDYLAAAREILVRGRAERGRRRDETRAAIGHALSFATWKSLTREQGLDDVQAAELMRGLVRSSACRSSKPR
jgi:AcrR family transcriptional regulator